MSFLRRWWTQFVALITGGAIGITVLGKGEAHGYNWQVGEATSYCTGTATASGMRPDWGMIAHNGLPLGSWIEVMGPPSALRLLSRRFFQVQDRGGPAFLIDLWTRHGCGWSWGSWGRRRVQIRTIPRHHLLMGKPEAGWEWTP